MTKFTDIKQPTDPNKKILRIIAPVEVPKELDPFELMNQFIEFCKEKGWLCSGGGVQFPDK